MSDSPRTKDAEGIDPGATSISVSYELRNKIRHAKTGEDETMSYDAWLRENLSLET